ncbi:DUF192 domain-containing protein [Halosimplex rubrum]|uniref:DUF192 domain-containing protein n=1 Tax=Halosimplex rubrum TaxID=869889 RepID=A0A7D5P4K3_9EURY|nr:DUF192 domain-containing protein [Halosimplex rubrum]QLH77322.1 DUF192 domain-containing protein [Halosimplex rubrum]
MRLVHESADGDTRTLATDVERADSLLQKIKGLMGKSSLPDGYALVFDFGRTSYRDVHMLFVRTPLDVVWLLDDEVVQVKTLEPWRGTGVAKADCFVELPGGAADGVEVGDRVYLDGDE